MPSAGKRLQTLARQVRLVWDSFFYLTLCIFSFVSLYIFVNVVDTEKIFEYSKVRGLFFLFM